MYLNGKPVFMRLVLDQGFYPDGVYTAPGDSDLLGDIQLSMDMGFNGARLHEKVFEPRFLYWADRMGYMVWGEFPNWGVDTSDPSILAAYQDEWLEAVRRDMSHPSIVGWCPFNETWDYNGRRQCDDTLRSVYLATYTTCMTTSRMPRCSPAITPRVPRAARYSTTSQSASTIRVSRTS